MAVPIKQDLAAYRGDTLGLQLRVWEDSNKTQPADFSEAVVVAQVRTTPDTADVAAQFDVSISGNTLTLTLDPKQSRELTGKYTYDIEVDWDGTDTSVQTVLAGTISVASDVTRVLTP